MSDLTAEQWFQRLSARRNAALTEQKQWWSYYEGNQPSLHLLRLLSEQDNRFGPLRINWSQVFTDTVDERMFVEGFTLNGDSGPDDELWRIWQRNDMSEYQSENNVASLVTGCSYMMVGPGDDGALLTVESPDSMAVEIDPLTRRVVAALKFYKSDAEATTDDRAVLLLPNQIVQFEVGKPVGSQKQAWMAGTRNLQSSPLVPVVPFPNRQRQRVGHSELESLRTLVDNADIVATSMMASVIHHAMPRMLAINVAESLFMNEDGTPNRQALSQATGSLWIIPAEEDEQGNVKSKADSVEPDIKQLQQTDLRNFHDTLSTLGRIAAGLCGLPPHAFGFGVADNPASADGIRASENKLVSRVERLQIARGNGYERVMRLAMAVEGRDPARAAGLETNWRSAATPTQAAKADAAVKMYAAGLFDAQLALEEYGTSQARIKALIERQGDVDSDPALRNAVDALRAETARNAVTGAADGSSRDV